MLTEMQAKAALLSAGLLPISILGSLLPVPQCVCGRASRKAWGPASWERSVTPRFRQSSILASPNSSYPNVVAVQDGYSSTPAFQRLCMYVRERICKQTRRHSSCVHRRVHTNEKSKWPSCKGHRARSSTWSLSRLWEV